MPVLINAVVLAAYALAPGARPAPMAGGAHRCTRVRAARMGFFENFFEELDNTIDDFANKRLGNGANFYGKRKSNIYGEGDAMRKRDSRSFDREEDYTGPGGGSYFVLSKERDAQVAAPLAAATVHHHPHDRPHRHSQGRPLGFLSRKEARAQYREDEEQKWAAIARAEEMAAEFAKAAKGIATDDEEELP